MDALAIMALSWHHSLNSIAIMRTTTTATTPRSVKDEQFLRAYRRIRAVRTRPTTLAAREFFADDNWQTLPLRLLRLCNVLEQWVCTIQ
jgi:hypothetical protein